MQKTLESEFCGQKNGYSLSKTLRFELKPVGRTLEMINKNGLIASDQKRAQDYKTVKTILDNYNKFFIDDVLQNASFNWRPLAKAIKAYQADKSKQPDLEKEQKAMRAKIVDQFKSDERFVKVTAATPSDLLKNEIPKFLGTQTQDYQAVSTFLKFATYFKGYQENRANMYSPDAKATAISNRLVNENFPKFLQNIESFSIIEKKYPAIIAVAEKSLHQQFKKLKLSDIFDITSYNKFLTQKGIDFYNQILGGMSGQTGTKKIQGLNECINQYWQQNPQLTGANKRPLMFPLYKQILSDRASLSFIPPMFTDDNSLKQSIEDYWDTQICKYSINSNQVNVLSVLKALIKSIGSYDQSQIYINAKDVNSVSLMLFGNWDELQFRMRTYADNTIQKQSARTAWLEKSRAYSLAELDTVLAYSTDLMPASGFSISDYFNPPKSIQNRLTSIADLIKLINQSGKALKPILQAKSSPTPLREDTKAIQSIKEFLDLLQQLLQRIRPLMADSSLQTDSDFYSQLQPLYSQLNELPVLYNKVRNYLTQRIPTTGKFKLTFECPTLCDGWDLDNEKSNLCILFTRNAQYYLGIMNPKQKTDFSQMPSYTGSDFYQKITYKYLPPPIRMLPKTFFAKKYSQIYAPSSTLLAGYKNRLHDINDPNFDINFCRELIDFYKDSISKYPNWKIFNFKFSQTTKYNCMEDFYDDISQQAYNISFQNISATEIDNMINSGKLYLFQIYNKDFSPKSKGTPNLHTLYLRAIFDKQNLTKPVIRLNGGAELFFRKSTVTRPIVHKSGTIVVNRATKSGQPIRESVHTEIYNYLNDKLQYSSLSKEAQELIKGKKIEYRKITYDITKDRHFTVDKFLFHVPISINCMLKKYDTHINESVLEYLRNNEDIRIIGIDRGERNLIYISIIDQNGVILVQKSYNIVPSMRKGITIPIDYHAKLDIREKERLVARNSWQSIGKIAELKEGYLSAVIPDICQLMVKYNAIVVMEDLNFGFKRGRFHVEKQVYQKFEKMLIDKLNYLVFKGTQSPAPGSILNGYQLARKFKSFSNIRNQSGFIFYIPAHYTSKIDPVTGFVNIFDLQHLTNVQGKYDFFSKFDSIAYDKSSDSFCFSFDYLNFGGKAAAEMKKTKWEVYSHDKRIVFDKATKGSRTVDPTSDLKRLFASYNIGWNSGKDILPAIKAIPSALPPRSTDRPAIQFFDALYAAFRQTLQMRNSNAQTGDDYIISPVKDANGQFFDSRKNSKGLPVDADANGAYHIALKGLLLLNRIDKTKAADLAKMDLRISNKDWFEFRQR